MLFTIPGKSWQICDKSLMKRIQFWANNTHPEHRSVQNINRLSSKCYKKSCYASAEQWMRHIVFLYINHSWQDHITSSLSHVVKTWKQRLKCVDISSCLVFKELSSMLVECFCDLLSTLTMWLWTHISAWRKNITDMPESSCLRSRQWPLHRFPSLSFCWPSYWFNIHPFHVVWLG